MVKDPANEDAILRGVAWLRSVQNPDGGWGESPASYGDRSLKGVGPSTAAQTAWALLGLLAAGDTASPCFVAGLEFLIAVQDADGTWTDDAWTGTGFPEVFYLNYHLYATYFPLLLIDLWQQRRQSESEGPRSVA